MPVSPPAAVARTEAAPQPDTVRHRFYETLITAYLLLDDGDQRVLSHFGLTSSQLAVLKLLDPTEGVRPIDLTGPLLLEKSSVSRLVERLVQEDLVRRVFAPHDRRSHRLVLTERGVALRERAQLAHEQSLAARLDTINPTELIQLSDLLDALCQQLQADLATRTKA
jgi:DNA-binding MarR family transcriptional regulator